MPLLDNNKITYDEFIKIAKKSNKNLEFINGIVYDMGTPTRSHQAIIRNLCNILSEYFYNKKCDFYPAPLDLYLFEEPIPNRVQPDIMIICNLNKFNENETQYNGIPTIVIEILSPSTAQYDLITKMDLYTRIGIPEYWIVSPKYKEITIYKPNQEGEPIKFRLDQILTTPIFPNLNIDLKKVFDIKPIK